jgi:HSP20 family protein
MRERSFGSFERRFELPEGVDADKIEASFKKGARGPKSRKEIEVKAA